MNISQVDLADKVDVSPSTVGRWLKGERTPEPENTLKLGNALDYSPGLIEEMLGRSDPDASHFSFAVRRLQRSIDRYEWNETALDHLEEIIRSTGDKFAGKVEVPDIGEE